MGKKPRINKQTLRRTLEKLTAEYSDKEIDETLADIRLMRQIRAEEAERRYQQRLEDERHKAMGDPALIYVEKLPLKVAQTLQRGGVRYVSDATQLFRVYNMKPDIRNFGPKSLALLREVLIEENLLKDNA